MKVLQTKAFPEDKAISNSIMGKNETQKEHTFTRDLLRHKKRALTKHHQRRSFFESKNNANDDDDDDDRAQNDDAAAAENQQNGVDVESGVVWGET